MTQSQQNIVILGAGESGTGAALLAKAKGFAVFVSDSGSIKQLYKDLLIEQAIPFEEGGHNTDKILSATIIIKSPGIPDKVPIIQSAKLKGIQIIDEIAFAARFTKAKIIAITGTNGKTTTTGLVFHILKKAGLKVAVAGNIGKSMAMQLINADFDFFVLELSSFQLDGCQDLRVNIAILTNITPDHLDRYDYNLDNYIISKFGITRNQIDQDAFIYCADDPITIANINRINGKAAQFPISITQPLPIGASIINNQIQINTNQNSFTMLIHELALQGKHNQYNSMAAGIAAKLLDIRSETVRESLNDFKNAEHRLEMVANVNGIEFINDSKATNINSTWYALESMVKPTVLILGGVDKGNDYLMLADLVKDKVKAIVCLGTDNKKILAAFNGIVPTIVETTTATEAVNKAYAIAKKGEAVLLSPACASFDLFENYEDRGRQFKNAVRAL
ncbi:MAG: UDP-N-acetylmuramoyl-L-alanine--D-glutamate ligase [Bacteroidota bacterium]|jgi:UDP-N-acetylmuramoylalanine--D-glutamate ligase